MGFPGGANGKKNPPTNTYTDTHNIHVKFEVYSLLLKLVYFI